MNKEEIIKKILNKQSITREEAIIHYGEETVLQMDKQYELTPTNFMTEEEKEEYTQYVFKEQIEQAELIEKLQQSKENQILNIVSSLKNDITKQINSINFETLYNEFVTKKKADNEVRIDSYKSYQGTFHFTRDFFQDRDLNTLNFKDQDSLKTYLQTTKSKKRLISKRTMNNHIQTLQQMFNFGEQRELLNKNFLKNIKPFKKDENEPPKENYTDEQLLKILTTDKNKFYSYNRQRQPTYNYFNLFKICIFSGTRISEILKLKKENVLDDRFIIKNAKTVNGNRTIPIHLFLKTQDFIELINNLNINYKTEKEEKAILNYHDKNVNKILRRLDINLKQKQTFHTFRGTFMEKLINKDITKKTLIQMMVGHSLPDEDKLTMQRYVKKIDFELYQDLMKNFELDIPQID